jgi:hypothetical protein
MDPFEYSDYLRFSNPCLQQADTIYNLQFPIARAFFTVENSNSFRSRIIRSSVVLILP